MHHLLRERFMVALAPEHPLAAQPTVRLADLRNEDWTAALTNGVIVRACRAAGFEPHLVSITRDQLAIRSLITPGPRSHARPRTPRRPVPRTRAPTDRRLRHRQRRIRPTTTRPPTPPPPRHPRRARSDLDQPHPTPNRQTSDNQTARLRRKRPTQHRHAETPTSSIRTHRPRPPPPRHPTEPRPGYAASTEHPASSPATSDGRTTRTTTCQERDHAAITPTDQVVDRTRTPGPALIPGLPAGIIDPARTQVHRTADGGHRNERNVAPLRLSGFKLSICESARPAACALSGTATTGTETPVMR